MTREEIIKQAGRNLGDTSQNFIEEVLNPAFDFVLLDLAQYEAIRPLRRTAIFKIKVDVREYETREICQLPPPHHPGEIVSLTVWSWGNAEAIVPRAKTDLFFESARLTDGEATRGRWKLWRLYPNNRILQVWPPADQGNDGVECEVLFSVPPAAIALADDVLDVEAEDIGTIVAGIRMHGATFGEDAQAQLAGYVGLYEQGKKRMWGRRWNSRAGRIQARD